MLLNLKSTIMKNTIEIKIECKGQAVGTLGWFNSIIKDSELVIKNNKIGLPSMFLKMNLSKTGDIVPHDFKFICRAFSRSEAEDTRGYRTKDNYMFVYSIDDPYHEKFGLFDVPLTPACREKVVEFIESAVEKYSEWWENDGKN
jgi:hypothetical protein